MPPFWIVLRKPNSNYLLPLNHANAAQFHGLIGRDILQRQ
jgi:hypothetical protein